MYLKLYTETDIGKIRETNQDMSYGEVMSENIAWTVVCDGMGGTGGGDIASNMAVDEIKKILSKELKEGLDGQNIKYILENAVKSANGVVFDATQKDEALKKMGTTVVLCVMYNGDLYVIHAGDSRAYISDDSEIKQITTDHSIVQEMVALGDITKEQAKTHPQKNIITRALGIREEVEPDYQQIPLDKECLVLLCTDGLTNHLNDEEIHKICSKNKLDEVAEALVNEANNCGGTDNITVSILKI